LIDEEALDCMSERALEILIPIIGDRLKFLKLLKASKEVVPAKNEPNLPTCVTADAPRFVFIAFELFFT